MITITVKGLANFMTASPRRQRKIVHDFKYPADDESAAQQKYYHEARTVISAYHKKGHPPKWLLRHADALQDLASHNTGRGRQRLNHNARAVRSYHEHFSAARFQLLDKVTLTFDSANVRVKVTPDLHVTENGQEKIIKLEFTSNQPDARIIKIVSQIMYESANHGGITLPSAAILYYDVPRGAVYKGARCRARMLGDIQASCQTIEDIWRTI